MDCHLPPQQLCLWEVPSGDCPPAFPLAPSLRSREGVYLDISAPGALSDNMQFITVVLFCLTSSWPHKILIQFNSSWAKFLHSLSATSGRDL